MKNWKLIPKIIAINCGIAVLLGLLIAIGNGGEDFGFVFGVVCLIAGVLDLGVGILLLLIQLKEWGQGFLSCAGILLLLSGISCGTGFANLNFH
ncbi:MAG TPA: hypothetical protein VHB70_02130 [Parafilimonas sp.]|nr:hypothetical protein [Parafilimonas sp.]